MICRNSITKVDYEYTFENDGNVRLRNLTEDFIVRYEDWCFDYFIVDKWRNIDGTVYS